MTDQDNQSCNSRRINAENQNIPEIAEEAWAAMILANNIERLFSHSTGLVRLKISKKKALWWKLLHKIT
jgi:hypothetical protein